MAYSVNESEHPQYPPTGAQTISVPSIPSEEAFGSLTVVPGEVTITVPSIGSQEAFGTPSVEHVIPEDQVITVPGIPSAEAFGSLLVQPGEVIISIPSIASQEQFGTLVLAQTGGPQVIEIPSIQSGEAFGVLNVNLGPPPQIISMPSIASAEAFGGVVIEQSQPEIAIAMPSIDSAEEFGIPSLILGDEPIYLPPPGPNDEPGAGTWDLWVSGTPAYLSRNGFEAFITGLWYPGASTYTSYGRVSHFTEGLVEIPQNDSRRASIKIYLDDPIIRHIRPFSRMLRIHYRGRMIYWGVLSLPHYDLAGNTVQLNSVDPSIRLYHHMLRFGDLENTAAGWGSPPPGGLGADGKGMVYVSTLGMRLLRDAGNNLEEQTARGVPDLGIVNGYDDWHIEPGDADGFPDWIEVGRGDRVLEKMKDLSNQVNGPDFEFEPISGQPGAYARLNTYYKQGTDKTGSVAFYYGTMTDNLENIEVSYGEEFVTHVHTLDRGAKYRYTEANVDSSAEHGIYVYWDATDYDTAKLTPAMREAVLRASAKGILAVYGRPLESYTLHCKIETNTSPWYMRDYKIGDIIKIGGKKGHFEFEDEVRITSIALEQVDAANNIRPRITVSPTVPTIDTIEDDPDYVFDPDAPDVTDPTVTVTSPTNNSEITGSQVSLYAYASDNISVQSVQFYVNGVAHGSPVTTYPYSTILDTTVLEDGPATIYAVVTDTAGNAVESATITVTVNNTDPAPPPPPPPPPVGANPLYIDGRKIRLKSDDSIVSQRGMNMHFAGFTWSADTFTKIAQAGFTDIRGCAQWDNIEPNKGQFNATEINYVRVNIERARAAGLRVRLLLLINSPQWVNRYSVIPSWSYNDNGPAYPYDKWNTKSMFDVLVSSGEPYTRKMIQEVGHLVTGIEYCNEPDAYPASKVQEGLQRMMDWARSEPNAAGLLHYITNCYSSQSAAPEYNNWGAIDMSHNDMIGTVHTYYAPNVTNDPGWSSNGIRRESSPIYWNGYPTEASWYDTVNKTSMLRQMDSWEAFSILYNMPIELGEIGVQYNKGTAAMRDVWMRDWVEAARLKGLSGIYWWIWGVKETQDPWTASYPSTNPVIRPEVLRIPQFATILT